MKETMLPKYFQLRLPSDGCTEADALIAYVALWTPNRDRNTAFVLDTLDTAMPAHPQLEGFMAGVSDSVSFNFKLVHCGRLQPNNPFRNLIAFTSRPK
ncbi:hypothetical protein IF2G_01368 [Cordyceps javanica]|nr:hypothetical protein IF2G_01368 [Cordyceps javanica]